MLVNFWNCREIPCQKNPNELITGASRCRQINQDVPLRGHQIGLFRELTRSRQMWRLSRHIQQTCRDFPQLPTQRMAVLPDQQYRVSRLVIRNHCHRAEMTTDVVTDG